MSKNCLSCALAKDQGKTIACTFDFGQVLEGWPMAPLCKVKVTTTPQPREKIPDEDCAAWRPQAAADPVVESITVTGPHVLTLPAGVPMAFTVKSPNREEYRKAMQVCGYRGAPLWRPGTLLHYSGEVKTLRVEVPE